MPAFVRTPGDERLWASAKRRAADAGFDKDSDGYYAYANAVFHRAKGIRKARGGVREFMRIGTVRFSKAQPRDILEMLSELEHNQWMHWTKTVAGRGVVDPAQVAKWRKDWVPYSELDEKTKEYDRVYARKAIVAFRHGGLAKSHRTKPLPLGGKANLEEAEKFEPKGSLKDHVSARAVVDGHALVQRPDHPMAIAGRVVATGRDGIHLRDDGGVTHRVRHEHVLDHQPPIEPEEWLDAAQALHRQGVPVDVEDRFAARVSPSDQALLDSMKESGSSVDTDRLSKEGSPDDIKEVLGRSIDPEPKPSQMPTVVSADREREAPGWEQVFPGGKGRVSRQRRAPAREWAEDNDAERDRFFDEAKATGLVSAVRVSPESEPADQEHLLRYAANALRAIAEVVDPPERPPALVVAPTGVQASHEEVGAHYNRRANELQIGMGEPESITHAYGHVFDAAFGNGKYASSEQDGPLAPLLASLRQAKGTADLDITLATAERREEEPPDSPRRFWTSPAELFAQFFEQYVDSSLGAGKSQPHHAYVRGVEQPIVLNHEEMAAAGAEFKRLLGTRDRNRRSVRKITAEVRSRSIGSLDKNRANLLEAAKGSEGEVGGRLVSALTHGIHSRHLRRAPDHYTPEQASEHRSIVGRAERRSRDAGGTDEVDVQPSQYVPSAGRLNGGRRLRELPDDSGSDE